MRNISILESEREGTVDRSRDKIVTARERHGFVRKGGVGYGARAYRTKDFLYIRNYEHENWPAGDPPIYGDVDVWNLSFRSPTKVFMLRYQDDPEFRDLFELGFGKRSAEELYDLRNDSFQMRNVANEANYKDEKSRLSKLLTEHLKEHGDPRKLGLEMKWIGAPFYGNTIIKPSEENQRILNMKESYSHME